MPTRDDVARRLAQSHFRVEPGIRRITRLVSPGESDNDFHEPVKLLEVNEDTIPAGIVPIYFGPRPTKNISYPVVILEITPEEFDQIGTVFMLPEGWSMGEEIERLEAAGDARA